MQQIWFNKEYWRYYNHRVIQKQGNQSDCGILVVLNAFAKANNSPDIELETVSVKWRNWAFDCCLKLFPEILISFNATFCKNHKETVKHSYCLQNYEQTKIQGEKNHEEFHGFMTSISERKYLLHFGTTLMNIENVSWSSSELHCEKEDLKRKET